MTPHHHDLEIELLVDLKEIPNKLETFTSTVKSLTTQVVELKTLYLLNKVTKALNKFSQVIESASKKLRDASVPSIGQAGSHPAKGEKNTQQVTISYPTKSSSQLVGELIKKDKGKEVMSSKDVEEEKTKSDSDDDTINLTEQIKEQKRIEESVKADIAKQEVEIRKEEWIDLLGVDVVTKYYKANSSLLRNCLSRVPMRVFSHPSFCMREQALIPKTHKAIYNSLIRDCLPHLKMAFTNHSLCPRVKPLILKTQRKSYNPLI
ncbi:hypothetical protein Tco_0714007 [Tanacetum coccineum]